MNSGTKTTDAAGILAVARGARATANAAEAQVLASAVDWAHLHTVSDLYDAATWWSGTKAMGQDTGIPIAGEGAPLVSEFAVLEFASALGLTRFGQELGRVGVGAGPPAPEPLGPGAAGVVGAVAGQADRRTDPPPLR